MNGKNNLEQHMEFLRKIDLQKFLQKAKKIEQKIAETVFSPSNVLTYLCELFKDHKKQDQNSELLSNSLNDSIKIRQVAPRKSGYKSIILDKKELFNLP